MWSVVLTFCGACTALPIFIVYSFWNCFRLPTVKCGSHLLSQAPSDTTTWTEVGSTDEQKRRWSLY